MLSIPGVPLTAHLVGDDRRGRCVLTNLPRPLTPSLPAPAQAIGFREAMLRAGGEGLLMTTWSPLKKSNRAALLAGIRRMGPICRGEE